MCVTDITEQMDDRRMVMLMHLETSLTKIVLGHQGSFLTEFINELKASRMQLEINVVYQWSSLNRMNTITLASPP